MENSFRHWVDLVELLVRRDLKVRYRASFLGYLWSMVNPLLMMSVMVLVFSYVMKNKIEHYPIYILSGQIGWNIFAQSLQLGVRCFTDNASLMRKVKVPAWVFPTSIITSACFHASVALIPYFLISLVLGVKFGWAILQLPFVFLLYFIFIEGLVLLLGSTHVFFRDVGHVIEPALQILFFATPIIYSIDVIPSHLLPIARLNPMLHYISGFRSSLYSFELIGLSEWGFMILFTSVSFGIGVWTFNSNRKKFLYYI